MLLRTGGRGALRPLIPVPAEQSRQLGDVARRGGRVRQTPAPVARVGPQLSESF